MNLEKEFIPYEQALTLKELGLKVKSPYWYNPNGVLLQKSYECNENTIAVHVNDIIEYWDDVIKDRIDVPTYSQAFRWFREKYGIEYNIFIVEEKNKYSGSLKGNKIKDFKHFGFIDFYGSYEEAESECLKKLIEICQKK